MRLWQRRAHPWIWLIVALGIAAVFAMLVQSDPTLMLGR